MKPSNRIAPALAACLLMLAAVVVFNVNAGASSAAESNWPAWRGPEGSGVSAEKNLPEEWAVDKNVLWKTPLAGRGHSSPIVWGKRVFVTTAVEGPVVPGAKAATHMVNGKEWAHPESLGADRKHSFKTIALDRDTGKLLWETTAWEGTPYDNRHRKSSYAASTPATDGRLVFSFFGAEGLYAHDAASGKLAWKADLGKIGTGGMGTGTSPVVYGNVVIIQADEEDGERSYIVGFDRKTGKEVWKTSRKVQASWTTPLVVNTGKRTELITLGNEFIISYDPATGKELWRSKGVDSNAIPSPVASREMVYVSAGYPVKTAFAIRLGGSGDLTNSKEIVWKYAKGTAYVPSPIYYDGYFYLTTDRGILTCLDARTGEVKYEGGRIPVPATFTASPVAYDGKLLLTSEDGDTFVIKAGPAHEVIRTNSIGEPVYASPAIADGKIFIRGEKNLYAIGRK